MNDSPHPPNWGRKIVRTVDQAGKELDAQGEIHDFYKRRHYSPPPKDLTVYLMTGMLGGLAVLGALMFSVWFTALRSPQPEPTYAPQPPIDTLPISPR